MLLDSFGGRKGRIAEFQFGDLERCSFDADYLHVAFTTGISNYGVFEGDLQPVRREQFLHSVAGQVYRGARFRQRAIEERQFGANGVAQLGIREPRNVVEVGGDTGRFLDVIGHQNASEARLEVVTDFSEQAALHELVGRGLQIIAADLGARDQAGYGDNLGFGEQFFAFGVDLAQSRGGSVRSLRRSRESGRQ